MTIESWEKISTQIKYKNPWWEYRVDKFKLPSGKVGEYNYIHSGGMVIVVPMVDDKDSFLLQKQYRYLFNKISLEFPAGWVPVGGDPAEYARNELIEETGYDADFIPLGAVKSVYGLCDGQTYLFLAKNLRKCGERKKENTEEFESNILSASQINEKILNGGIDDGNSISAWFFAKNYLNGG